MNILSRMKIGDKLYLEQLKILTLESRGTWLRLGHVNVIGSELLLIFTKIPYEMKYSFILIDNGEEDDLNKYQLILKTERDV